MKAIFRVPFQVGLGPVLPPMSGDDGLQLHYDDKGTLRGGYSCIGYVDKGKTCLVLVEADKATIQAMAADPDYLFLKDDGGSGLVEMADNQQKAQLSIHKVTDAEYADGVNMMAAEKVEPRAAENTTYDDPVLALSVLRAKERLVAIAARVEPKGAEAV